MKNKKLYMISLGPGDYEQLTIKTVRYVMESDILILPIRNNKSRAGDIIYDLKKNLNLFNFSVEDFPEIKFIKSPMGLNYKKCREEVLKIVNCFENNNIVTYGTLGDVGIYSRSYYLLDIIKNEYKDVYDNTVISPGISSFSYASAISRKPLCTKDINLNIITHNNNKATTVYMKPKLLSERGLDENVKAATQKSTNLLYFDNLGTDKEKMVPYKGDDIKEYMSLLIDFVECDPVV